MRTKNYRSAVCVVLIVGLLSILLTACSSKPSQPAVSVGVKILADSQVMLEETVKVEGDQINAETAVKLACKQKNMQYTFKDGMFDHFGGKDSTKTDGWILYCNDKLADVGAGQLKVIDNDVVEFRYVNYDEAFGSAS